MKNKKLNNKGVTLIELIVSFVIVAVAVIYFYQMLSSVTKMYAKTKEDINHEAKVNYVFRLIDEAYVSLEGDTCSITEEGEILNEYVTTCEEGTEGDFNTIKFSIPKDDKDVEYVLYKYPNE